MTNEFVNAFQDFQVFGEFGGINPSITDSSTFTFMHPATMEKLFHEEVQGCFLYSRHLNPANENLSKALSLIEGTEDALVTASGMGAISTTLLQICQQSDEIICHRVTYGGTYALLKNFFPRLGIKTHFVNILDVDAVEAKINKNTKVIYCESLSNPMLEIPDLAKLRNIADKHNLKLIVDNTFTPYCINPIKLGAHIVIHSLTKYINGASDTLGGCVCSNHDFISSMKSVNDGAAMLIGPVLDSLRSSSILKNLRTLHIRMRQHSKNATYLANKLEEAGIRVIYPGLKSHPQHEFAKSIFNLNFGFSGMITIDAKTIENANNLLIRMQEEKVGYFAVSLGYYKTLFSSPGRSTSSEIPEEEQVEMGMTPGLIRFSVGLDDDIERTFERIKKCLSEVGML
ncbi:aminotransferase class I/II-fold pyridoxal phosphate-dependent enzyme [Bacteroidetes/Chlorobi group bacterium ChocPot_Mid]|jgi:methionine-gamma-lyase|nr:MAG: aminotransferase class I/II-fold pyridoxal phosphate-dependent enzyme [Bacteroidetes/Chlorobi group bacterium ChocPot_Mid]